MKAEPSVDAFLPTKKLVHASASVCAKKKAKPVRNEVARVLNGIDTIKYEVLSITKYMHPRVISVTLLKELWVMFVKNIKYHPLLHLYYAIVVILNT